MLTENQIEELSRLFKIDSFSIFREYLQLVFLNEIYQTEESIKIFFKGGTCIHLMLNSPRFSEDLDFSTPFGKKEITRIIKQTAKIIQIQIPQAKIEKLYETGNSIRFKMKYQTKLFKYPLRMKIDFQTKEKPILIEKTPLITQFPMQIFPVISRLANEEILAEKTQALLTRCKGRDFFDLWFLLGKKIKLNNSLIKKKRALLLKIKKTPDRIIQKDLSQFLPASQRQIIPLLKTELIKILSETVSSDFHLMI